MGPPSALAPGSRPGRPVVKTALVTRLFKKTERNDKENMIVVCIQTAQEAMTTFPTRTVSSVFIASGTPSSITV